MQLCKQFVTSVLVLALGCFRVVYNYIVDVLLSFYFKFVHMFAIICL